ncbi:MAG: hypothetical protein AAGA26_06450 [Pseudomonadota bacterium]
MHKILAAITVTAIALAGTTALAESTAAEKHAKVQHQFEQLDKDTNHGNPIAGLFGLVTAPIKLISPGAEGDASN